LFSWRGPSSWWEFGRGTQRWNTREYHSSVAPERVAPRPTLPGNRAFLMAQVLWSLFWFHRGSPTKFPPAGGPCQENKKNPWFPAEKKKGRGHRHRRPGKPRFHRGRPWRPSTRPTGPASCRKPRAGPPNQHVLPPEAGEPLTPGSIPTFPIGVRSRGGDPGQPGGVASNSAGGSSTFPAFLVPAQARSRSNGPSGRMPGRGRPEGHHDNPVRGIRGQRGALRHPGGPPELQGPGRSVGPAQKPSGRREPGRPPGSRDPPGSPPRPGTAGPPAGNGPRVPGSFRRSGRTPNDHR